MKQYIYLIILVSTTLGAHAQNSLLKSLCASNPPDILKLSYEEADKKITSEAQLLYNGKRVCPEYAINLVDHLRRGGLDNDKKVLYIWLLGELHHGLAHHALEDSSFNAAEIKINDSNSVGLLIEIVDLKATKLDPKTHTPRWGQYPAQEALVKIDQSSVNPVLKDLPSETNELRVHLLCAVLVQVEGYKNRHFSASDGKTIAQNQIKQMLLEEKDSAKRANLAAALKELEK